jgi:hypothetical protein
MLSWIVPFSSQLFLRICIDIYRRSGVSSSNAADAGKEQSSDTQRILRRHHCQRDAYGDLTEMWERKILNIWPRSFSKSNTSESFMLGVFLIHGTLTPHKIGYFLMQKAMELVVSSERDNMTKACLGFLV